MTMLMIIMSSPNINANSMNKSNDPYLSLHKFLANYKPNVKTDEQAALENRNQNVYSIVVSGALHGRYS
jgi:hypothetical protein